MTPCSRALRSLFWSRTQALAAVAGLIGATLMALGACSYAEPNAPNTLTVDGARVRVAEKPTEVIECKSLGLLTARAASVLGKTDLVADQQVNARNKAAAFGGDTVIVRANALPVAEPGAQTYEAFLCRRG